MDQCRGPDSSGAFRGKNLSRRTIFTWADPRSSTLSQAIANNALVTTRTQPPRSPSSTRNAWIIMAYPVPHLRRRGARQGPDRAPVNGPPYAPHGPQDTPRRIEAAVGRSRRRPGSRESRDDTSRHRATWIQQRCGSWTTAGGGRNLLNSGLPRTPVIALERLRQILEAGPPSNRHPPRLEQAGVPR